MTNWLIMGDINECFIVSFSIQYFTCFFQSFFHYIIASAIFILLLLVHISAEARVQGVPF